MGRVWPDARVCGRGARPPLRRSGSRPPRQREPHKLDPPAERDPMPLTYHCACFCCGCDCLCAVHLLASPTSSVAQIRLPPFCLSRAGATAHPQLASITSLTCLHILAPCRLHRQSHSRHDTPRIRPQQWTTAQRRLQLPHRHPRRPQQQQPQLAQLHHMHLQQPRAVMLLPLRCTL
jgi:hypothetical protein